MYVRQIYLLLHFVGQELSPIIACIINMNNTTDFQDNSTSVIPQDIPYKQDIDKHLYNCDLFKLYVDGILNTVIVTFGFVSNIFTVITLWDERQKNGTSFLLICLELADNFVLLNGSVNTVIFVYVVIIIPCSKFSQFCLYLKNQKCKGYWFCNGSL